MLKVGDIAVDPFRGEMWRPGAVGESLDRALACPPTVDGSGRFESGYDSAFLRAYYDTLGGRPAEEYDPNGFLAGTLGLDALRSCGRTNEDLLRAFKLVRDYKPGPTYLPIPEWLARPAQGLLLALNRLSTGALAAVESVLGKLVTRRMEKIDREDPHPFGRMDDIIRGEKVDLPVARRYFGVVRRRETQHAWGQGVHRGSPTPDHGGSERFGTYDIAVKLGFSPSQARRIADECIRVDTDETHYRDPIDPSRRRITRSGSGGANGDLHWHFNRAASGAEDTRISAARVHLDRAVALANQGWFDAAEREIGVGLHSLQDMFAHGQISPLNHSLLDEFPDLVRYNPVGMYETARATEAYLERFIDGLNIARAARNRTGQATAELIAGDAPADDKRVVAEALRRYPSGLRSFLRANGVTIYVAAAGTKLTELGFGVDLDGDGVITPDRWVDVDGDGQRQDWELEDRMPDGRRWDEQPAAYDHERRLLVVLADTVADPKRLDRALRHEIRHVVDRVFRGDAQLGVRWQAWLGRAYEETRRAGEIGFDEYDPAELYANGG